VRYTNAERAQMRDTHCGYHYWMGRRAIRPPRPRNKCPACRTSRSLRSGAARQDRCRGARVW
jgi:hypothetical protein